MDSLGPIAVRIAGDRHEHADGRATLCETTAMFTGVTARWERKAPLSARDRPAHRRSAGGDGRPSEL